MSTNSMFHVIPAADLNAERDVFLGLPVEGNSKQVFHRVPIRSSNVVGPDGHVGTVQMVNGETRVVQKTQGLRRLLLQFPCSYSSGVRMYAQEDDRQNVTLGFALFDHRTGPTPEQQRAMTNIDNLAMFLRRMLFRCEKIRTILKLPVNPRADRQQLDMMADMMEMHVARPASAGGDGTMRRYCYCKVVLPSSNAPTVFQTFFLTPAGDRIPFEEVQRFTESSRGFQVVPVVEVEDIFVNKAVKSIQLKLRECMVFPPTARVETRASLLLPNVTCSHDMPTYNPDRVTVAAAAAAAAAAAGGSATAHGGAVVAVVDGEDEDDKTLPLGTDEAAAGEAVTEAEAEEAVAAASATADPVEEEAATTTDDDAVPPAEAEATTTKPTRAAAAARSARSATTGSRREREGAASTSAAKRARLEDEEAE